MLPPVHNYNVYCSGLAWLGLEPPRELVDHVQKIASVMVHGGVPGLRNLAGVKSEVIISC